MAKKIERECRLCLRKKELRHSHIFPEFFYGPVYDEKHSLISAQYHPDPRFRIIEKGIREYLLCEDCEAKLNRFETPSADVLREAQSARRSYLRGFGPCVSPSSYEYKKFKLFGLSLIWRACVSKRPGFEPVSLGPVAEDMRVMLQREDPGPPNKFPFFIVRIDGTGHARTIVTGPQRCRFRNHHAYQFIAFGFEWTMLTTRRASNVPADYPCVGFGSDLIVPVLRTTDKAFIDKLTPAKADQDRMLEWVIRKGISP